MVGNLVVLKSWRTVGVFVCDHLLLTLFELFFASCDFRDLQSYLSDLSLFIAFESRKLYILVDNRPWLRNLGSRPAHLWQLMVTKVVNSRIAFVKHSFSRLPLTICG